MFYPKDKECTQAGLHSSDPVFLSEPKVKIGDANMSFPVYIRSTHGIFFFSEVVVFHPYPQKLFTSSPILKYKLPQFLDAKEVAMVLDITVPTWPNRPPTCRT